MALPHEIVRGNHTLTLEENSQGGFTVKGNGFRVAEFIYGGGEFHLSLPGNVPDSNTCGFHAGENQHIAVTLE